MSNITKVSMFFSEFFFSLHITSFIIIINSTFQSHRCAACSKCFLTSNKLKYHIRRTHLQVDGPVACTICNKECKSQRLLLTHQKSHIRIDCPYCTKIISTANYEQHVKTTHLNTVKRRSVGSAKTSTEKKPRSETIKEKTVSNKRNANSTSKCETVQVCVFV